MANPTTYYRPRTLKEALALAAQPGALVMAGGSLTFGHTWLPYETVIDLQDVPELKQVTATGEGLHVGAALTLGALLDRDAVPAALKTALTRSISPHVLNGASVGEAVLRRAEPGLREWLAVLVAMGAAAETVHPQHPSGPRERHLLLTADQRLETEVITALILPLEASMRLGLAQVARTPADQAIVCAAACVLFNEAGHVKSAMAALGGVSAAPVEGHVLGSLASWPLNHETAQAAAEQIAAHLTPPDDALGSSDYRQAMAAVSLTRALEACMMAESES